MLTKRQASSLTATTQWPRSREEGWPRVDTLAVASQTSFLMPGGLVLGNHVRTASKRHWSSLSDARIPPCRLRWSFREEFLWPWRHLVQFHLAFLMPLHSRIGTDCVIHHKVIQDFYPGIVVRQVVIVLSCYLPHLGGKKQGGWRRRVYRVLPKRTDEPGTQTPRTQPTFLPANLSRQSISETASGILNKKQPAFQQYNTLDPLGLPTLSYQALRDYV